MTSIFSYIGDIFLNIPKVYRELRQSLATEISNDPDIKVLVVIVCVLGIGISIATVVTSTPIQVLTGIFTSGWLLFVVMLVCNTITRMSFDEEFEVSKRNVKPHSISYLMTTSLISMIVFCIFLVVASITILPLWLFSL